MLTETLVPIKVMSDVIPLIISFDFPIMDTTPVGK